MRGAVQFTSAWPSAAVAVTAVGTPGGRTSLWVGPPMEAMTEGALLGAGAGEGGRASGDQRQHEPGGHRSGQGKLTITSIGVKHDTRSHGECR